MVIGAMAAFSSPAFAVNDAMKDLLKILRDKGSITNEEYEALLYAAKADAEHVEDAGNQLKTLNKNLPKIETKDKIEISSADGNHKWKFGGRVHLDSAFFNDDELDVSSGSQFRRIRLDVDGTAYKDWFFKFQYDFTDNPRVGVRDMFVRYDGWKPTSIIVGNYKQPFSLEELTSSNNITFIERSLANTSVATLLSRRTGIGVSTAFFEKATLMGSVFYNKAVGGTAPTGAIDEGFGIAGRGTFMPYKSGSNIVHLGLAGVYMNASQDRETLAFSGRPEVPFFSAGPTGISSTISTGALGSAVDPVENITMFGAEAAVVYGPASVQGEYIMTNVERKTRDDVDINAFYVEGSYFLTGESRPYSFSSGSFGSIKPSKVAGKGGWGAWQVALRYSSADFTDTNVNVFGGEEDNLTVGLNWYPTPTLKFMANYVTVLDLDRATGNVQDGDEPDAFLLRSQWYW
jgi:phosphate-selective porin OprO/OprP